MEIPAKTCSRCGSLKALYDYSRYAPIDCTQIQEHACKTIGCDKRTVDNTTYCQEHLDYSNGYDDSIEPADHIPEAGEKVSGGFPKRVVELTIQRIKRNYPLPKDPCVGMPQEWVDALYVCKVLTAETERADKAEKALRKQIEVNLKGKPALRDGVSPQLWCDTYDKKQQLQENLKTKSEALKRYGEHETGCMKGDACNCGFEQALKG
jgi:hypothetical protein